MISHFQYITFSQNLEIAHKTSVYSLNLLRLVAKVLNYYGAVDKNNHICYNETKLAKWEASSNPLTYVFGNIKKGGIRMSTKMEVKRSYDVVDGPSADRLFDACKYAYDDNRIFVNFAVAICYTMPPDHPSSAYIPASIRNVRIVSIEHENGTGHSFNIRGYCDADLRSIAKKHTYTRYHISLYYDSRTRKGRITFYT